MYPVAPYHPLPPLQVHPDSFPLPPKPLYPNSFPLTPRPLYPRGFTSPMIKGASTTLVEGDLMTLTCDTSVNSNRQNTELQFAFYGDGREVQKFGSSNKYKIQSAHLEDSGNYECEIRTSDSSVRKMSQKIPVVISELFSSPEINVSPDPVVEGDVMTLTCDTRLSPDRQNTELQFAFYRGDKNIQEFRSSNKYEVQSTHLEDSGSYYCEVKTSTNNVRKTSHNLPVLVKGRQKNYMLQNIFRLILSVCLLIVLIIIIVYHVKQHIILSPLRSVPSGLTYLKCPSWRMTERFSIKPHVIFTPNWNRILTFDKIIITCEVGTSLPMDMTYHWYKDGIKLQTVDRSITIGSAQLNNTGEYQCQVGGGKVSDPVTLEVMIELFSTSKIKVYPDPVVEGDVMTLTCDTGLSTDRRTTDLQFTFYRNGRKIQGPSSSKLYKVQSIQKNNSGDYTCEVSTRNGVKKLSQEQHIPVQELFSTPKMKMTPDPVVEGDFMTLTCDTSLSPDRKTTDLQFTFYRDGRKIQGPSSSKLYKVQSIQKNNSGDYTCEVCTRNGVKKLSQEQHIPVQDLFSTPDINVITLKKNSQKKLVQDFFSSPKIKMTPYLLTVGDHMSLKCDTVTLRNFTRLQFAFDRDGRNIQGSGPSNTYKVQSAQLEDAGNYTCVVKTSDSSVMKRSQKLPVLVNGNFVD
ncbi:Fc receptor-like protein 5 [Rhinoderma darwinii]|uniref:Fc receptor-like protein 5 n=1 Tax=Rhinoderma darwinii TaxID=43563 RepID=UPI003F67051E